MTIARPGSSGTNARQGLLLSLTTALFWGAVSVALAGVIDPLDGVTASWARFLFALAIQSLVLKVRHIPWSIHSYSPRSRWLMLVAAAGMVGNFAFFASSLQFLPASTAQTITQLQPSLLLLVSIPFMHESVGLRGWLSVSILIGGILLFLSDRLDGVMNMQGAAFAGVALCLASVAAWTLGGLAQKMMSHEVPTAHVTWLIYLVGAVLLLPLSSPGQLLQLDAVQLGLMAFLCVNTLVAYGAFALAIRRWELSRVSAIVSLFILFTYALELALSHWQPGLLEPEHWTGLKLVAVGMILTGSLSTALQKSPPVVNPALPHQE